MTSPNPPIQQRPKFLLVDDNIRDEGGHYYELATLLLNGAEQLGFQNVLATHQCFEPSALDRKRWQVHGVFQTRRMIRWSLGVDGDSRYQRDLAGNTVGGTSTQNMLAKVTDLFVPPAKRPKRMLKQWSEDLCRFLAEVSPTAADTLLVNTGDDFAMLALANAMKQANIPPMRIDVLFHFALYETGQKDQRDRLRQIGRQIRRAITSLQPHDVHLHATTDSLAAQLRETESGKRIHSIPYPTRSRAFIRGSSTHRLKAVLAGLPRAEKGRAAISDLLAGVEDGLLKHGRYQISMQMPAERWQAMVPSSLHRCYENSLRGKEDGSLDVMTANLSTKEYHDWLDTADLGLFLYDAKRYVARCSGVLLEMLARGVPVIVPDHCWLADQVRLAGGHRSIGFIYQDRSEIPELMRQFAKRRDEIQPRSIQYATTIADRHNGRNSLVQMGIKPVDPQQQAA